MSVLSVISSVSRAGGDAVSRRSSAGDRRRAAAGRAGCRIDRLTAIVRSSPASLPRPALAQRRVAAPSG